MTRSQTRTRTCLYAGTLLLILTIWGSTFVARTWAESPFVCKMAVIAPKGTSWSDVGDEIKEEIEAKSNGRIRLIWYFGGVMGDEKDELKKIRHGQLQGAGFTLMGLGLIAPEVKILEMPFLFSSYEEKDFILEKTEDTFQNIFADKGYVVLGWLEVGFVQLFSSKDVQCLDDLRKSKMWVWGGEKIIHEIFTSLGFRSLIPLQLPDVLQSLQVGMVDSFFGPYYPAVALQWHTHARSMTHGTFSYTPAAILVTKKFFDSLPEDLKPVFLDPWKKYLPKLTELIRKDEQEAFEGMKKAGTKVIEFPPEDMEYMHANAHQTWEKYSGEIFPRELLEEVLAYRETFRQADRAENKVSLSP